MKYYSKQTNVNYNYQTNKFDIDTSWIPEIKLPAFIDKRTLGNSHLFNLVFNLFIYFPPVDMKYFDYIL